MDVLGISALHGPSAACLLRDGRVIAASREDVFSGVRDDSRFPSNAVTYCLRAGKVGSAQLHSVRVAGALDSRVPPGSHTDARGSTFGRLSRWFGRGTTLRDLVALELDAGPPLVEVDPALAEAAAVRFASPFPGMAVLVLGPDAAVRVSGRQGVLEILGREAPGGDVIALAERLLEETGAGALGLAGVGAQDRAANGRLLRRGFAKLWIHPATGGGAAALGAALLGWQQANVPGAASTGSDPKIPSGAGPSYNAAQIRTFLRSQAILADEPGRDEAPTKAADLLAQGHRVAWFDGRLDFGAETAGSRSLLRTPSGRHPADAAAGETLAVVAERVTEIFEIDGPCSPLLELPVRSSWRERLGITGDGARAIPVTPVPAEHRGFRTLLARFEADTGCPALVAQPLRREGGPVACAPNDAWAARDSARAAALVMGPYLIAGAPLTENVRPRDIRVSTSTPESLE